MNSRYFIGVVVIIFAGILAPAFDQAHSRPEQSQDAYFLLDETPYITLHFKNQSKANIKISVKNDNHSQTSEKSLAPNSDFSVTLKNSNFPGKNCNPITITRPDRLNKMLQYCLVVDYIEEPFTKHVSLNKMEFQVSHSTLDCKPSTWLDHYRSVYETVNSQEGGVTITDCNTSNNIYKKLP